MSKYLIAWFLFLVPICQASEPLLSNVEEFYVESGDAKLFCKKMGHGKPLLVLHGGPGMSQEYLLPQMSALAETHLVIFYDQRGCGKSLGPVDAESITMAAYIDDIEKIRIALDVEKISILGHSWGGFLAMHYAIAHAKSIDQLILSNSMPASSEGLARFIAEWYRRMLPFNEELNEIHHSPGFHEGDPEIIERLHRLMFRTYCYDPQKADLLNLKMESASAMRGAQVYTFFHQTTFAQPFSLFYDLYSLNIPTLVIHGDNDPIPSETAREIHQHLIGSTFILMEKCGHFPYVEDPKTYFHHLKQFLTH